MFAKLKHVAIVSDRFALLEKFYQTLFGMKSSAAAAAELRGAATVGDGYVGSEYQFAQSGAAKRSRSFRFRSRRRRDRVRAPQR